MKWPLVTYYDQVTGFTDIDEVDFPLLGTSRWRLNSNGYVARSKTTPGGNRTTYYLHRVILCAPSGVCVDHINGNRRDNRRINLRFASYTQNGQNSVVALGNNPRRGVSWSCKNQGWYAYINVGGKMVSLGTWQTLELAIAAREEAERKYFGEFAPNRINLCSA